MILEQNSKPTLQKSWWKKSSRTEKWLLLIFITVLLTLILMAVISIKLILRHSESTSSSPGICLTPSCVKSASKVLQKIDLNVDPCEDFYKFACGNFIKETVFPPDKTSVSSFSIVSDKVDEQMRSLLEKPIEESDPRFFALVKSLYRACMNTTNIETHSLLYLKKVIKKLGGWPVIEGTHWDEKLFNWKSTNYEFMKLGLNYDIFFEFAIGADIRNSSTNTLTLDQPYIVSFDKLMRNGFNESKVRAYYDYMVNIAVAFGAEKEQALKQMKDVIDLDIAIVRITVPSEDRRNVSLEDNPMTISELQQQFQYVPWLEYINTLLQPITKMKYNDKVTVTIPKYFKELGNILRTTPKRILANYMYWKMVKGLVMYLNNEVRASRLEFTKAMTGTTEHPPRWQECVREAKYGLPIASGALYVRYYFKKEAKQTMVEMVDNIKHQFTKVLRTVDWMDEITRKQALQKAAQMFTHIAYPEELLNDEKLEEYYKNLTLDPLKYVESMQNLSLFEQHNIIAELDIVVNKKDWRNHADTTDTNAYYIDNENSIAVPAGILQEVFFDNSRPQYMNYGAIGAIIGHEVTHGFDDEGGQFDKDGNLVEWWQTTTKTTFDAKTQCIIYQYSNITVPEINMNLNGINTQGENIADNGGVKYAYFAYKKWINEHGREQSLPGLPYTPEQMFWISVGNTCCNVERTEELKMTVMQEFHSPSHYRVNVPLMNSEVFAKDFNCPLGSGMNPVHKCVVW